MKIATYNVGLFDIELLGIKLFEFSQHTRSRAEKIPSELATVNCDVLFIQELYHSADLMRVKQFLGSTFPYATISCMPRSKFRLGHGLAIFSKYPMLDDTSIEFKSQLIDERYFGPKGCLAAWIDIPLIGKILLANVHTSAGGIFEHPESVKSDQCRSAQLGEVSVFVNDRAARAIVAGDFNCGPDVSAGNFYSFLESGYFRPEEIALFADLGPTWDPENALNVKSPHSTSPPQRIDHVLFSNSLFSDLHVSSVKRIFRHDVCTDGYFHTLSDHYGLLIDLNFKK